MLVFVAHIDSYCDKEDFNDHIEKSCILLIASSFAEATEKIENYYGIELERITLLEAIADGDFVYLTEEAEKEIRNHKYNDF